MTTEFLLSFDTFKVTNIETVNQPLILQLCFISRNQERTAEDKHLHGKQLYNQQKRCDFLTGGVLSCIDRSWFSKCVLITLGTRQASVESILAYLQCNI